VKVPAFLRIALAGSFSLPIRQFTTDALTVTGLFRLFFRFIWNCSRHTGMRSSGRREKPVKDGKSVCAVTSLLSPTVTVSNIAQSAARPYPVLQTGSVSADTARLGKYPRT
jgi:hypothetical protein